MKVSQGLLVIRAVPRHTVGQVLKGPPSNPRGGNNVFTVITLKAKVIPSDYDVMCLIRRRLLRNVVIVFISFLTKHLGAPLLL